MAVINLLLWKSWLILFGGGLFSGILAGFLGIGGGTVLVPLQKALGFTTVEAVATSSLAILITATSASIQNWRMGFISLKEVFNLGFPALFSAQLGVFLANVIPEFVLLICFGLLLLTNIYLVKLRKHLHKAGNASRFKKNELEKHELEKSLETKPVEPKPVGLKINPVFARIITGGLAGVLAGLFGIGGGVIMVPLQMLLLGETIKVAIQNSLGVIVITAISASIGHGISGNVLFLPGLILGFGGLLGAQISTRFLPKFPDRVISIYFRILLISLAIYMFWQAMQIYQYQQLQEYI